MRDSATFCWCNGLSCHRLRATFGHSLADRLLDGFSIEQVEGSLQEGLTLTNTQYKMAGVDVSAGLAQLHFDFSCLWKYDACLENLSLKDMQVAIDTSKLPPSQPQEESEPFTELNLPLGITAKKIALDNISVKVDALDIQLDHFQSGIQGKGRSVTLFPTELKWLGDFACSNESGGC